MTSGLVVRRERFGAVGVFICPMKWGASWSYLEFPNHLAVAISLGVKRVIEFSQYLNIYIYMYIYIYHVFGAFKAGDSTIWP